GERAGARAVSAAMERLTRRPTPSPHRTPSRYVGALVRGAERHTRHTEPSPPPPSIGGVAPPGSYPALLAEVSMHQQCRWARSHPARGVGEEKSKRSWRIRKRWTFATCSCAFCAQKMSVK